MVQSWRLEDSGKPRIESVDSVITMMIYRGPWQGFAHNDDNNRELGLGVVHTVE